MLLLLSPNSLLFTFKKGFTLIVVLFSCFLTINTPSFALNPENFIYVNNTSEDMAKALEAEILVRQKKFSQAAKIYVKLSLKSYDPSIAKRATIVSGYAKDYLLMLQASNRWLTLADNKLAVRHVRITILSKLGKVSDAAKEAVKIIKESKDKDKYAILYDTLLSVDSQNAKKIFDYVYEKYKEDYLASFYYTQILIFNFEYERAINVINAAMSNNDFDKKDYRWGHFLATSYYEIGSSDEAIKTLKTYIGTIPDNILLNELYAEILTKEERYKEAIEHYRFMAAKKLIDFSDKKIAYTMALLNIETGRYKEAKNFFSKLSKDEVHYLSGVIKSKSGKTKEAINLFSKVAVSESEYIHCVYAISEEYIKVRDVKALKEYIKKEVSKNPSRDIKINLYLIESEVLYENKLFSDAYNSVNNALKDFNDSVDLLYTRALVAEKIDRIDILEKDLKMILKDDPNNAQALNALGYTWIEHNKNFVEAKSYIDKALSLLPHDAAILDSKGWALYKEGKYKDSEKYLKKAFRKNKDSEIVSHLIFVLTKLNKIDEANKLYKKYAEDLKLNKNHKMILEVLK